MLTGMLCAVNTSSRAILRASAGSVRERVAHARGVGFDESGMRVPVADVGDLDVGQPGSRSAARAASTFSWYCVQLE